MKKLFLRAEFGPLWEPWEVDEIGRKYFTHILGLILSYRRILCKLDARRSRFRLIVKFTEDQYVEGQKFSN